MQEINCGCEDNDGTGDTFKLAFTKINNNFDVVDNDLISLNNDIVDLYSDITVIDNSLKGLLSNKVTQTAFNLVIANLNLTIQNLSDRLIKLENK